MFLPTSTLSMHTNTFLLDWMVGRPRTMYGSASFGQDGICFHRLWGFHGLDLSGGSDLAVVVDGSESEVEIKDSYFDVGWTWVSFMGLWVYFDLQFVVLELRR